MALIFEHITKNGAEASYHKIIDIRATTRSIEQDTPDGDKQTKVIPCVFVEVAHYKDEKTRRRYEIPLDRGGYLVDVDLREFIYIELSKLITNSQNA